MRTPAFLLLTVFTLLTTAVDAQELESLAGVRLNFDRAGARALAMGSTAIALQDPGAAAANPAAIAGAARAFSVEWRRDTMEGRYTADSALNTIDLRSTTDGIRSASLTVPMGSATWSLFYDRPLDVRHSTVSAFDHATSEAMFVCDGQLSVAPCNSAAIVFGFPVTYPIEASLEQRRYGAAVAWSSGPLALGASLRREELRQQTAFVNIPQLTTPFLSVNTWAGTAETVDDADLTWSGGATWTFSPRARIGASYASGGSFAGARTFPDYPTQSIEFRTPASLAAGISVDPLPQLTLTADAVRVRYSEMMHDRRSYFPQDSVVGYPDVTELHAGAEWRAGRLALRAGWWRDPAHGFTSLNGITPPPPTNIAPVLFDATEDHVTAGIGYGDKTRFDASIDRGSHSTRVSFGISSAF